MSAVPLIILVFFFLAVVLGAVAFFTYQRKLRRAKAVERGLKMVPILIHLPPPSSDTEGGSRDTREVMREKTAQAEVLYNMIAGTAQEGFKSNFYGQRHLALELIAIDGVVHFFAAVPVALVSVVKKAVLTAYPGARLEEVEDHNIFNQEGRLAATLGGEMVLRQEYAYPIATYAKLERDPMEALLTSLSALDKKDGVAVQIMLRPAGRSWTSRSKKVADGKRKGRSQNLSFSAMDLAKAAVKSPDAWREQERARMGGGPDISNLQLSEIESIEEKTKHPGFEVLIRVIVSTGSVARSQQLLSDISTTFALFEAPGMNGFKFLPALDVQGLVTAFIFRFFPSELKSNVLNSVELATLFHFPDSQFTPTRNVEREQSKQVDGPVQLSAAGLLFGHNEFRGVNKEIRLSEEDRRRHTYILGQTGTGKSTMLENLAVQDMLNGNGFAFIDPHGDSAEKLLALVPKDRAEDIVYFNPADTEYPLGLNLFEFSDPSQKDFLVQETINMLYKLYDPGKTGIIGPRYEHWYRNAALTLMSDPNGATFIEIPKVFTDTDYLKAKFKYLTDPTVVDFWTKEMGQTSDYHKSEMLGWFVSKFGAFQNNEMMRNIIGQTKSSFNIRDIMDKKKILIVNLSKGRVGELNSQLLGMIFVIKFQAAAMSRADMLEDQRNDFCLYVDEFQNFSTDSFASILSEARKYRLNLIVANQFMGQLSDEIREAVFGNIGTIVAHRMGPEDAEFMVKQFSPVFDASDLVNMPNFNSAVRLMIGGLPSQPFTMRDSAPLGTPNLELGLAVKQLSAAKFGQAKAVVEADIAQRLSSKTAPAPLPVPAAVPAVPAPDPAPVLPAEAESDVPASASAHVAQPEEAWAAEAEDSVAPAADLAPVSVPTPISTPTPTTRMPHPALLAAAHPTPHGPVAQTAVAAGDAIASPMAVRTGAVPIVTPATSVKPQALSAQTDDGTPRPPAPGAVFTPNARNMAQPAVTVPTSDPLADVADMAEEGGFSDMSAPLGVPQAPAPMVAPDVAPGSGMAMIPPPIGAPPVDLLAGGGQPMVMPPASAMPVVAPVVEPATSVAAPPVPTVPAMPSPMMAPMGPMGPMPMGPMAPMGASPVAPPVPSMAPVGPPVGNPEAVSSSVPAPVLDPSISPNVPPIGAPPVSLSAVPQPGVAPVGSTTTEPVQAGPASVAPKVVSDGSTLTLADITGGKALPKPSNLSSVPVMTPGAEPVVPVTPAVTPASVAAQPGGTRPDAPVAAVAPVVSTAPVAPMPVAQRIPLGSGQPLPGDPFASIEILSDLTPPPEPASQTASVEVVAAGVVPSAPALPPVGSGEPLPGDPHAAIDVLGAGAQPPVVEVAAPIPVAQAPETPATPVLVEPTPEPAAPAPALVPPTPTMPMPMASAAATSSPVAPEQPAPSPMPAPASSMASVPTAVPAPVPAPVPVASVSPAPPVSQPEVSATAPVPAPAPVPQPAGAEDLPPEPLADEAIQEMAAEQASGLDQSLIHFVDPGAEAVLSRDPDAMADEESLLSGLPEGVEFVKAVAPAPAPMVPIAEPKPVQPPVTAPAPFAPVPVPVPPVSPVPAVSAQVSEQPRAVTAPLLPAIAPAQSMDSVAQEVAAAPVPAPEIASAVDALDVQLQEMATTPPPIGAPPVDLEAMRSASAAPAAPAPAPKPVEPEAPKPAKPEASEKSLVPGSNANLAEALLQTPSAVKPEEAGRPQKAEKQPQHTEPSTKADQPKLESVVAMHEHKKKEEEPKPKAAPEHSDAEPKPKPEPVPEPTLAPKSEPKPQLQPQPEPAHKPEPKPVSKPKPEPVPVAQMKVEVAPAASAKPQPAPVKPVEPPEAKQQPLTESAQIEKAERTIDDLLSVSLIHPEASSSHQRLPQPVEAEEVGVDMEMAPTKPPAKPADAPVGTPVHMAQHHELKVIQPLEPIVSPRLEITEELSAMQKAPAQPAQTVAPPLAVVPVQSVAPVHSPAPQVAAPVPAPDAIMKHEGDRLPEQVASELMGVQREEEEVTLPQAESLAADEVAKARAEREAHFAMQKAQPAKVVATPAPPMAQHIGGSQKPEPKPERHKYRGKEKPAERIESEAEAEHNNPTEAEREQSTLTGKLIMPTGEKPKPELAQPPASKPKKLAPGEVFVDEKGNVIIGE